MANNFCTKCGAPTQPGAEFCTECGAPIPKDSNGPDPQAPAVPVNPTCPKCHATLEPGAKFCTKCGTAVPQNPADAEATMRMDSAAAGATIPLESAPQNAAARTTVMPNAAASYGQNAANPYAANGANPNPYAPGATSQMPPVQTQASAYRASEQQQAAAAPQNKKLLYIVIAAAAAIILALLLVILHPWSSDTSTSTSTTATQSSSQSVSSSSSSSSSSSTSSSTSAADAAAYKSLLTAYNKLDGFDQRIRACANAYNDNTAILNGSMTLRQSNADTCKALEKEIQAEMNSLNTLGITTSSKYYQDYRNISNLQNDLYQRIDVMVQSWNISLKYSNTSGHEKEIYAPIDAQNDSNGINIYKTDYVNNYEAAKPVEK